ncbi:Uncharacterized mitochondrial protein AtMg01250, partial [Striga hermonthica]
NKIIDLGDEDVQTGVEECHKSLFGKIVGEKRAHFLGIKRAMSLIWKQQQPMEVRELGPNFFHFMFENTENIKRIEGGTNWIFENQYVIISRWKEGLNCKDEVFSMLKMWVQVHHVPINWLTNEVGMKIGKVFPTTANVIISNLGGQGGRILKLLVTVDLREALPRCATIRLGSQMITVTFKYERLANLCYYCGMVGHIENSSATRLEDIGNNGLKKGQYGDWLRASEGLRVSAVIDLINHRSMREVAHQHPLMFRLQSGKNSFMALKLDVVKAYGSLEWKSVQLVMMRMGFHPAFVKWVLACIQWPTFSFNLNGLPQGYITASRGIRQGDPLSPYLFILTSELLSARIKVEVERGGFKEIRLFRGGPELTHIMFADNILV